MINEYGHYEELAALASGGYLSEDELSDLQAHSETCADCRNALAEFRRESPSSDRQHYHEPP